MHRHNFYKQDFKIAIFAKEEKAVLFADTRQKDY